MLLGKGLSWNTTRLAYPFIYRNINPAVEPALRTGCLYLTENPVTTPAAAHYELVREGLLPDGEVYTDEEVRDLTEGELEGRRYF